MNEITGFYFHATIGVVYALALVLLMITLVAIVRHYGMQGWRRRQLGAFRKGQPVTATRDGVPVDAVIVEPCPSGKAWHIKITEGAGDGMIVDAYPDELVKRHG